MEEVARDYADEEQPDLEQQDRGRDHRDGDAQRLFDPADPGAPSAGDGPQQYRRQARGDDTKQGSRQERAPL